MSVPHALVGALALCVCAAAVAADEPARDHAGIVTVIGGRPSSLPTEIPTTIEGITGAEITTRINASDGEDALKYLPSLLVRKRYIGDYNHAVLSSRASGTGNSARSMVFVDGILISNYLGNGATFAPRWGFVTPSEIDRVDVLYGPFSAAYPGNSVGAVVDYVTRLPTRFEAHAMAGYSRQPFELYGSDATYDGWQSSASLGDRRGGFAWQVDVNRLDSQGQPLTFATKFVSATTAAPGTPVDGAVPGLDKSNVPWYLIGAGTQYHTRQDQAKLKLAQDFGASLRAQYTAGVWRNRTLGQSETYLSRVDDGSPFYSGVATIGGANYNVAPTDFSQNRDSLRHTLQGLTLATRGDGAFDATFTASRYDYGRDLSSVPTTAKPGADGGGPGRVTDLAGTGWDTLALKGIWRTGGGHRAEFGLQQERYRWRQRIDNSDDWSAALATTPIAAFQGRTQLRSAWLQDAWTLDERWKAVFGGRWEAWSASDGARSSGTQPALRYAERAEHWFSPKAALGWQVRDDWALKLSAGRAVRAPTVGELFQGNAGSDIVTNPDLRPERSWTGELSSIWSRGVGRLRTTLFHESTDDALYSQAIAGTNPIVNSVQNIDRMRTSGLESAFDAVDLFVPGLDVQASLTYADSRIVRNASYVAVPGDTVGKQQPRVPRWRASALASWRATPELTASYGLRYGSRQYGTLNNSDPNGYAYQGFSPYLTTDLRLHWQITRQWSAAFGVDNLNNAEYWNFHPYPQRTYNAEVRFDL